ncbi:MAG: hypothetical protein CSB44_05150 [Gammaproteobacteria bacterium]|nr:MAG: hypothetical protein CSB44_05150 [Gammaproteobacteria bacterium]
MMSVSNRPFAGTGTLASAVVVLLLAGCSESEQLPSGATLSMSPETRNIEIDERLNAEGICIYNPDYTVDMPVVATLRDGSNNPIGGADVRVYLDWAENTFGARRHPLELYRDRNGNGVIDEETEYVSGADDDIAVFRTSEYGGSVSFLVRINLSCTYRGQVFAYSDFASAMTSIEITTRTVEEEEEEETTTEETAEVTDPAGGETTNNNAQISAAVGEEESLDAMLRRMAFEAEFGGKW